MEEDSEAEMIYVLYPGAGVIAGANLVQTSSFMKIGFVMVSVRGRWQRK